MIKAEKFGEGKIKFHLTSNLLQHNIYNFICIINESSIS